MTPSPHDPAVWHLLPKGGKKEEPYTLEQLVHLRPVPRTRVRKADDSAWVAWQDVSQVYPELAIVHLDASVDPLRLQPATFIDLLLDPRERPRLVADLRAEQGTRLPLTEHVFRLAPQCQATPDQLRRAVAALLRENSLEILDAVLFHPDIPEDLLLQLAEQGRCLGVLGHRPGPRVLLEKLARDHRYREAITTLALDYYGADSVPAADFATFVQTYCADFMLRGALRRTDALPADKKQLAIAIVGEAEPAPEYAAGMTELHLAAHHGDPQGLRAALDRGAEVNARDRGGWTALHRVASMSLVNGETGEAAATLFRAGADVDARDRMGRTPLMIACAAGDPDLAAQLMAAGAAVNARDNAGVTPLIEAASQGSAKAVLALLNQGADRLARTRAGETALDRARAGGWEEVARLLEPHTGALPGEASS